MKKTWKQKLHHNCNILPEIKEIDHPKLLEKTGAGKMVIPAPLELDQLMRAVPKGLLITTDQLRRYMNEKYDAVYTCPLCTGIFAKIAAFAAEEEVEDGTGKGYGWWRTLKANGELNEKFPGGLENQAKLLQSEGHIIISKGKKMFVSDFKSAIYNL